MLSYLFPSFGKNFESSTKWLSNSTPLIIALVAYFVREEITNWHYKKRSEAASIIIGKFRVFSKGLIDCVNARVISPITGEEAVERKVHKFINNYKEECLGPSAQFSISIRKEIDNHLEEMQQLANSISSAISIDTLPYQEFGKDIRLKANETLHSLGTVLSKTQDFLDTTFKVFLDK